jgi:hypothetical protein
MTQQGNLTVSGDNFVRIPLSKYPHHVDVKFVGDQIPVPCNPHHHDELKYFIETVDEDPRHHHDHPHRHHDREFFLFIEWKVSGVREIHYLVVY